MDDGEGAHAKVLQFSDSIIRIRPLDSRANSEWAYGLLFNELNDIGMMQAELLVHGIALRGGMSIGEVYYDEFQVFGPEFVRAYELESSLANYPRAIIDPELVLQATIDKRLLSDDSNLSEEFEFINSQVHQEADGIYFINYPQILFDNFDQKNIIQSIEKIRDFISKNLKDKKSLDGVTRKYLWLAKYFNSFIEDNFTSNDEQQDYLITNIDAPLLKTFLHTDRK